MTCDNCGNAAVYTVAPVYRNAMNFCEMHLPDDLRTDASKGLYPLIGEAAPSNDDSDSDSSEPADK